MEHQGNLAELFRMVDFRTGKLVPRFEDLDNPADQVVPWNAKGAVQDPDYRPVPCSNPELVTGYIAIKEIMSNQAGDFWGTCTLHPTAKGGWCECNMDRKREDNSYKLLVEHLKNGGALNQPVHYKPNGYDSHPGGLLRNGHHRICAAYDAGFTHVPYNDVDWGDEYDWKDTKGAQDRAYN